jgi:L-fuculose-phosphate aldolase
MPTDEQQLKERVASAYRVLLALGLFDYAGDASARIPGTDTFLIRHTRADWPSLPEVIPSMIEMTAGNIVKMDLSGRQLEGEIVPPLEVHTHTAIYRARPDVAAIVHAHAMMVTAFTMAGRTVEPVYARGVESTGDELPTFESPDPIGTPELGEQLAAALGTRRACLIRSHGLVTVGSSVEGAALAAINLEEAALMQWTASLLGTPRRMPDATIAKRRTLWDNPVLCALVWRYYEEATAAARPAVRLRTVGQLLQRH